MMQLVHALTEKGQNSVRFFCGSIVEDNLFATCYIEFEKQEHNGNEFLQVLTDGIADNPLATLSDLEVYIAQIIKKHNLPSSFSLSLGYKKKDGFYLKTYGEGKIYLSRGNNLVVLVEDGQNASGKIHKNDVFFFTNKDLEDEKELIRQSAVSAAQKLHEQTTDESWNNKICLICDFDDAKNLSDENRPESFNRPADRLVSAIKNIYQQSVLSVGSSTKGKKITLMIVIILFIIFTWSIGLGNQRRGEADVQKRIQTVRETVIQQLSQVDEVAYLNLPRAMAIINDAHQEVAKLTKEIGQKKELIDLENTIQQKENAITKKENKEYSEFYDLTIDNKQAKGDLIALDNDNAAILDRGQGNVYVLSLSKKSLQKRSSSVIRNAKLIAVYEDNVYILSDAIYKIDNNQKITKVIDSDKDWGAIAAMGIYNGNIYLLNKSKDQIYKYLVAENGYSPKSSYIKSGQTLKLSTANSITIDSSIYLGMDNIIYKFTAGLQDGFQTSYPDDDDISITKIFTSKDLEHVYVWSKSKASLYILGKDGTYERQIKAAVLSQVSDYVVYKEKTYVINGQKILEIDTR